jgi:hypothetical protein
VNIRRILTKLHNQRRAIDRAIVALEKIGTKPHVTKRKGSKAARKLAAPSRSSTQGRAQVIEFPLRKRAG